jgi:hypothetical protein
MLQFDLFPISANSTKGLSKNLIQFQKFKTYCWNSKVSSMQWHLILIWDITILSCHSLVNVCVL